MATIEERYGCSNCQCPCCEGCSIWDKVEGVTEQEEIDKERIAKLESFARKATEMIEAEKAFREHLESRQKELIDKACEFFAAYLVEIGYPDDWCRDSKVQKSRGLENLWRNKNMKTRISKLDFGNGIHRYIIAHKEHWWSRWHYVMDGAHPRFFTLEEIKAKEVKD